MHFSLKSHHPDVFCAQVASFGYICRSNRIILTYFRLHQFIVTYFPPKSLHLYTCFFAISLYSDTVIAHIASSSNICCANSFMLTHVSSNSVHPDTFVVQIVPPVYMFRPTSLHPDTCFAQITSFWRMFRLSRFILRHTAVNPDSHNRCCG